MESIIDKQTDNMHKHRHADSSVGNGFMAVAQSDEDVGHMGDFISVRTLLDELQSVLSRCNMGRPSGTSPVPSPSHGLDNFSSAH